MNISKPIHVISLGAGVQSSTMALMAAHGEITPMPDCAIFADTQAEPKEVMDYLDYLEPMLPFPVYRVTKSSLEQDSFRVRTSAKSGKQYVKSLIPYFTKSEDGNKGIMVRQCTADYKIQPVHKKIREIANVPRGAKEVMAIQWMGISRDEAQRMKPSKVKWIRHHYPLIDLGMYRGNCLQWMKNNNYLEPPRSACTFCPFHSNEEWRKLSNADFQHAVEFERKIQKTLKEDDEMLNSAPYLHPECKPLDEVDLSDKSSQIDMFGNECEGMCGV